MSVCAAAAVTVAACGSSKSNSANSSSSTTAASSSSSPKGPPIKIGLITSQTGALAPSFVDVADDFKARLAWQNAQGGVDGHPLQAIVVDDTGTAQGNLSAARTLVTKDRVAIVADESGTAEGAAAYLASTGIPVVGGPYSGPMWGMYKNMFSDWGKLDASYPTYSTVGLILKANGATSLGSLGYGSIPSSKAGAENAAKSAVAEGLKAPYVNTSLQPGSDDFSTIALAIKHAGVDALYAPLGIQGDSALQEAALQDGASIKHSDFVSGTYGVLGTPAQKALQGSVFALYYLPAEFNTPTSIKINKLVHHYGGAVGRPDYDFDLVGWLSANLAIAGLEATHGNTSPSALVTALTNLKGYTADGLFPKPVSFSTPSTSVDLGPDGCLYALKLVGSKLVPLKTTAFCGTKLH